MVEMYRHCGLQSEIPTPARFDTTQHGCCPFRHNRSYAPVSVIRYRRQQGPERLTHEVFGDEVGWVPGSVRLEPGSGDGEQARRTAPKGLVMGQHGADQTGPMMIKLLRLTLSLIEKAARYKIERFDKGPRTTLAGRNYPLDEPPARRCW